MRGEISLLSKKNKTKLLLESGFDIVIDYPLYLLLNSSDYFSKNAIDILANVNITHLAFGIESDSIEYLQNILEISKSSEFQINLKDQLKEHISYKKAIQNALIKSSALTIEEINIIMHANNTLALGYLNALIKYPNIQPFAVKRVGNLEENQNLNDFPSGTALRANYLNNQDISNYLPYDPSMLSSFVDFQIKYKALIDNLFLTNAEFYKDLLHINEGIENYIFKHYNKNLSVNDNIQQLANKKYSKSRIRRALLSMLLQIPKKLDYVKNEIRILGFNKKGQTYLKQIQSTLVLNISKNKNVLFQFDIKASKLYDLLTNNNTHIEEYQFPLKGE